MRTGPSLCRNSVLLAIALGALAGCQPEAADPPAPVAEAAAVISVEALRLEADPMAVGIRASGVVAYKRETALGFGAPGQIETLSVDAGDRVSAGQVIATLRKTTIGADEAEAALARQTAQQTFDRVTRLFEAGAASQADLDAARLSLERTRERVAIRAMAAGTVLQRHAEPGQTIAAGQPVVTLGETRAGLIVRASLTPAEVADVRVGEDVEVSIEQRPPVNGRIVRIAPRGSVSGTFEVEVSLPSGDGLRAGEIATIRLVSALASAAGSADTPPPAVFRIPALALIDARADQGVVFVIDAAGQARRRTVETGGVTDGGVAILKGLSAGERVITRGASMVREGDAVSVATD
jgi:RND family efflux transporter MFP subunit